MDAVSMSVTSEMDSVWETRVDGRNLYKHNREGLEPLTFTANVWLLAVCRWYIVAHASNSPAPAENNLRAGIFYTGFLVFSTILGTDRN